MVTYLRGLEVAELEEEVNLDKVSYLGLLTAVRADE